MGLKGFWLLSSSVTIIVKDVYIFLNVASNHKYTRVFKLLAYLGVRAHPAVLPKDLYYYNLSLLEGFFCLKATAFYRVSVEFPFMSSRGFKKE